MCMLVRQAWPVVEVAAAHVVEREGRLNMSMMRHVAKHRNCKVTDGRENATGRRHLLGLLGVLGVSGAQPTEDC